MKCYQVRIGLDDAAFEGDPRPEVARILRDLAERVERGNGAGHLRDVNGNTVGACGIVSVRRDRVVRP